MDSRRLRYLKKVSVGTVIALVLAIDSIPAWGYELHLPDISSTLSGYYSTAKNTLSNVKNKALDTLSSSKLNPANEAQRRVHYQAKDQALKGKIERVNQKVYGKYDSLVTNKIDGWISPETNSAVKFSVGVAEGIPKGLLDISMLGYNLSQRTLPQNLLSTSMTTYYNVKDNPDKYADLVKHPVQTGGAIAGALYNGGKQYANTVMHDPRAAGNLVGSFVGLGGAGKAVGVAGKGVPTAAKALNNVASIKIPNLGAASATVSTASRATATGVKVSAPLKTSNSILTEKAWYTITRDPEWKKAIIDYPSVKVTKIDEIFRDPKTLTNTNPALIKRLAQMEGNWFIGNLAKGSHAGQGLIIKDGKNKLIQWHPGGGHHGADPYWKVSSSLAGKIRIGPQFAN